jgi:hypothetical protein
LPFEAPGFVRQRSCICHLCVWGLIGQCCMKEKGGGNQVCKYPTRVCVLAKTQAEGVASYAWLSHACYGCRVPFYRARTKQLGACRKHGSMLVTEACMPCIRLLPVLVMMYKLFVLPNITHFTLSCLVQRLDCQPYRHHHLSWFLT